MNDKTSPPFQALSSQYSVFSSQFSVLSSRCSLLTSHSSATNVRGFPRSQFLTFSLSHLLMLALLASGCSSSFSTQARMQPVQIPSDTAVPRAVVYGSFTKLLPHFDVTPALQMFLYGPNEYGNTVLRNPQGMTLMGNLLLVADQGLPDVAVIDLGTGRSLPFTDPDHRPLCPVAVAHDDAHVYVADTTLRCVLVYDLNGRKLEEIAPTPDPNRTFRPASLLIDQCILYAGDIADHQVKRFDLTARQWLPPLVPPPDMKKLVAPAGLDMLSDGTLLIVDAIQGHVLRHTRDGRWLPPIGGPGRLPGQFVRPKQVAHTPSGLILVGDAGRQSVLVFDADGRHLMELYGPSGSWSGFTLPVGVLSLPAAGLQAAHAPSGGPLPPTDAYVLVSDELGLPSLTLVGFVTGHPAEVGHAR